MSLRGNAGSGTTGTGTIIFIRPEKSMAEIGIEDLSFENVIDLGPSQKRKSLFIIYLFIEHTTN
jgi:hypothetical protein